MNTTVGRAPGQMIYLDLYVPACDSTQELNYLAVAQDEFVRRHPHSPYQYH